MTAHTICGVQSLEYSVQMEVDRKHYLKENLTSEFYMAQMKLFFYSLRKHKNLFKLILHPTPTQRKLPTEFC